MIGLFEMADGAFSLASLRSAHYFDGTKGRAAHYRINRAGGDMPLQFLPHEYSSLLTRPVQLTPVENGTRLAIIYPGRGDEKAFADLVPILAWALCVDGQVRPVLPSGVRQGYSPSNTFDWHPDYVLLADGSLYEYGFEADFERYDSIDAVLSVETARAKRYDLQRKERQDRDVEVRP